MTKVKQFLDYERLLAFCLIGEELSLFYGKISSQKMGTEENVREVYPNPIANCFRNSTGTLEYMKKKLKLSLNMVTGVKIWCSQYDLKAKRQSSERKSINSLRRAFFNHLGVIDKEFLLPGQIVNVQLYTEM